MNNSEHWDEVYKGGRDFKTLNVVFLDSLLKRFEAIGVTVKSALDMGCGKGDAVIKLAKRGITGLGVDFSPEAIKAAQGAVEAAGVADKTSFMVGDIEHADEQTSAAIGRHELVLSKLTIAFIHDKKRFLEKVKNYLAPNGALVLITPVLFDGYEYSDRLKSIAVPYGELRKTLEGVFSSVEEFNREYFEESGCEITFIAKTQ